MENLTHEERMKLLAEISAKVHLNMVELGLYLGVSRSTIYLMIRDRELPYEPMSKRAYRFNKPKIDKWLADKSVGTVAEAMKKAT